MDQQGSTAMEQPPGPSTSGSGEAAAVLSGTSITNDSHPSQGGTTQESVPASPHSPTTGIAPRSSGRIVRPTLRAAGLGAPSPLTGPEAVANSGAYGLRTRQTRFSNGIRGKAPRLKLSLKNNIPGRSSRAGLPKTHAYMQGFEDREMDSSDEETGEGMAFEEQLILRMPECEATDKLRERVKKRDVGADGSEEVSMKFKDSRRAMFKVGETMFAAKLVDLPAIIESHKTLDNRRLFKVADISQMLLASHVIDDESQVTQDNHASSHEQQTPGQQGGSGPSATDAESGFNVDEYIYPHGITPPMKWARKRRFRKRAKKQQTLETVEQEVQRLLAEDKQATTSEYTLVDAAEVDAKERSQGSGGSKPSGSGAKRTAGDDGDGDDGDVDADASMAGTPMPDDGDLASQMDDGEDRDDDMTQMDEGSVVGGDDEDDDVDLDLQAELEAALGESGSDEGDDGASETASAFSGGTRGPGGRAASQAVSEDEDLWDDNAGDDDEDEDDDGDDEGSTAAGGRRRGGGNRADGGRSGSQGRDEEDDEDDDENDDDQAREEKVKADQLEAECREIDSLIKRKQQEADQTHNALIKKRQLDSLKRLIHERDVKRQRLATLREERKKRREEEEVENVKLKEAKQVEENQERAKDQEREKENLAAAAAEVEDEERRTGARDDGMHVDGGDEGEGEGDEGEGEGDYDEEDDADGDGNDDGENEDQGEYDGPGDGDAQGDDGQGEEEEEEEEEDDLWA